MGLINDLTGGALDKITGKDSAKAARRAGNAQIRAEREAREQLVELQQPFIDLGTEALPGLRTFIDDPTGFQFLQDNPLFDAAVENANRATMNLSAAGGRANSGGAVDQLFRNYLAIGDDFVNSAFRRATVPVEIGQNAASFTGTNVANSITNEGNARAARFAGEAAAGQQGINNILGILGLFR